MSDARTQVITLLLLDGDPEGLRTVRIEGRTTVLAACPVARLAELKRREEAQRSAVYFLVGEAAEDAREVIYVGECDSLADRFRAKHHAMDRADWRQIVVASTADNALNKAHARRAERMLVGMAKEAQRSRVLTDQTSEGRLDTAGASFAGAFVRDTALLCEVVGVSAFRPRAARPAAPQAIKPTRSTPQSKGSRPAVPRVAVAAVPTFRFVGAKDVGARLRPDGKGFLILAGSRARASESGSCMSMARQLRAGATKSRLLVPDGAGLLRFTADLPVTSTSMAANVVGGMSLNGKVSWVHEGTGQTYADWLDAAATGD